MDIQFGNLTLISPEIQHAFPSIFSIYSSVDICGLHLWNDTLKLTTESENILLNRLFTRNFHIRSVLTTHTWLDFAF